MQLTDEQLATWRRDGSLVVPNVFPPESYVPALERYCVIFPWRQISGLQCRLGIEAFA